MEVHFLSQDLVMMGGIALSLRPLAKGCRWSLTFVPVGPVWEQSPDFFLKRDRNHGCANKQLDPDRPAVNWRQRFRLRNRRRHWAGTIGAVTAKAGK